MAKPKEVTLNKIQKQQILSYYNGKKTGVPVKNARKISESTNLSRRQVMYFLEKEGLKKYSQGSYV
ncbi:MAG TPA: hypothetical protein PKW14_08325 [Bacteroidota bacterium]|nr:hypothetical protein [Bacteroidota bacterium]